LLLRERRLVQEKTMIELLIDHQPRSVGSLEHFPEKWSPVFRQKMRPLKRTRALSDSIELESALGVGRQSMNLATEPAP
jgi:hypothetical protein